MPSNAQKTPTTERLLRRAHSKSTASQIHTEKILHKPLHLHSTAPGSSAVDAREARRRARAAKLKATHTRRPKPPPLTAREKRKLCIYDIPKREARFNLYRGLWRLWCGYMRDILDLKSGSEGAVAAKAKLTPAQAGPKLVSADYHGAAITCVRSKCVSRVGVSGIVVRDLRGVFMIVTEKNCVKTLPKEHSIFKFEVPLFDPEENDHPFKDVEKGADGTIKANERLVFELHGEQFQIRAPDRTNKKFKMHYDPDL